MRSATASGARRRRRERRTADLRFELSDAKDSPEAKAIQAGIIAYNDTYRIEDYRELTIALKDDRGRVVGGLTGHTDWGWLFVKLLWISEEHRAHRLGTELMRRAEAEALNRGCHSVWLDTFSFQARGFYERLGYSLFGELPDYPTGHQRYFMRKQLRKPQAAS